MIGRGGSILDRRGNFFFTTASKPALNPSNLLSKVTGVLSLGVKRPGRESDHSSPFSVEVKNA
jgi:hypothetical protein